MSTGPLAYDQIGQNVVLDTSCFRSIARAFPMCQIVVEMDGGLPSLGPASSLKPKNVMLQSRAKRWRSFGALRAPGTLLKSAVIWLLCCDGSQTSHKNLRRLTLDEIFNTRLFRLKQRTLPWSFRISYLPGRTNAAADAALRYPSRSEIDEDLQSGGGTEIGIAVPTSDIVSGDCEEIGSF